MRTQDQNMLRLGTHTFKNIQKVRVAFNNQAGRKANGEKQDIEGRDIRPEDLEHMVASADMSQELEDRQEKFLKTILERFPIYTKRLKGTSFVKGINVVGSAWLLGELDIQKDTVSKWTQFAGYNPDLVYGKKRVKKQDYRESLGKIIGEFKGKDGKLEYLVLTDTLVRGDRKTPGFVCPFNSALRTALRVMADGMLKAHDSHTKIYYDLHIPDKYRKDKKAMEKRLDLAGRYGRYDQSEESTKETKKGGLEVILAWKDTTDAHRHNAAIRKMMKQFLIDLYVEWRMIEGLPVREPYAEEYLGKKHHG